MFGRLLKASLTDRHPAWWVPFLALAGGLAFVAWQAAAVKEWHGAAFAGLAAFVVVFVRYLGTMKRR